jgi:hypothetical protein
MKRLVERLLSIFSKPADDWAGSERRRGFRVRLPIELEVSGDSFSYLGKGLDLSPQGVRLRVRGPYKPELLKRGDFVKLKAVQVMYGVELHSVQTQVCWSKLEAPNVFVLALAFHESVENLRKSWVKTLLAKSLSQGPVRSKRVYLRVQCAKSTEVVLLSVPDGESMPKPDRFEVKLTDLSVLGCRMQTIVPISAGSILEVKIDQQRVKGSVVRCQKKPGSFELGIRFFADDEVAKKMLRSLKSLLGVEKSLQKPG